MNESERLKQRRFLREARPYFRQLAGEAEQVRLKAIGRGQRSEVSGQPEEEVRTPCGSGGVEDTEEGNDENGRQDVCAPSGSRPLDEALTNDLEGGFYR